MYDECRGSLWTPALGHVEMASRLERWEREAEEAIEQSMAAPNKAEGMIGGLLTTIRSALQDSPEDHELRVIEAKVLFAESMVHAQLGRLEIADAGFRRIAKTYEALNEPLRMSSCFNALAVVAERQGEVEVGLEMLERCYQLRREHGAPIEGQVHTLTNLGIGQAQTGDSAAALATFQFAEEMIEGVHPGHLGLIYTNRALIYRKLGERKRAHEELTLAVQFLETVGADGNWINAMVELAVEEIEMGLLSSAESRLQQTQQILETSGLQFFVPEQRLVVAQLLMARGQFSEADAELASGLPLANDDQRRRLLECRAACAEKAGDCAAALRWTREGHDLQIKMLEARSERRMMRARARVSIDIEEQQRVWMQAELEKARVEVQSLADRLEDQKSLLAAAAHDINNPLSVVLLLGELISAEPELLEESAQGIVDAARHMQSLLNALLQSNRPPSDAAFLVVAPTPLQPIIAAAHRRHLPLTKAKDQHLHLDVSEDVQRVDGDASVLSRVLDNLLSNAIKYTPAGGEIEIKAHQQDGVVTIEVLDTGPGLSQTDLERVFLFPQPLSAQPTQGESQHGLGLVTVRRMVKKMGGRVIAENRLKEGARFALELNASMER